MRLRFPCKPTNLQGYWSAGYIRWNLQGRHTFAQVLARQDFLTKRLIALGYLEQKSFTLGHQETTNCEAPLNALIRQDGRLHEPLSSWSIGLNTVLKPKPDSWMLETSEGVVVTVTTRPDKMEIWEHLLSAFDLTNGRPNKHLQATPR